MLNRSPLFLPPPDHAEGVAPTLGQEADIARLGGKARIEGELRLRVVEPHAVGADRADPRFLICLLSSRSSSTASSRPVSLKRAVKRWMSLVPLALAAFHQLQCGAGGNRRDDEVHRPRDGLEPRVGLLSQQLVQLGVDRMDRARKSDLDQPLDELVSLALLVRRGAHHGDASRPEEGLEFLVAVDPAGGFDCCSFAVPGGRFHGSIGTRAALCLRISSEGLRPVSWGRSRARTLTHRCSPCGERASPPGV